MLAGFSWGSLSRDLIALGGKEKSNVRGLGRTLLISSAMPRSLDRVSPDS
jgi:hypothetical protein